MVGRSYTRCRQSSSLRTDLMTAIKDIVCYVARPRQAYNYEAGCTAKNNFLRQISSADLVRFIYDECAI